MTDLKQLEIWLATGSQHLYGEETLKQVAANSKEIAGALDTSDYIPVKVVFKPVLTTPDAITQLCIQANSSSACIGLITWMHTFSPAKMWIGGLKLLNRPILHLHTQYFQDIPYDTIDMDYMNLHQSAHGGREYGFMLTRLRKDRKVVVGHWKDTEIQKKVGIWSRAAAAWHDWQGGKVARFGDNMREVAVTEGDKVEAQMKLGYSVNGYGVGDLVKVLKDVSDSEIDKLVEEYGDLYHIAGDGQKKGSRHENVRVQAQYEIGMKTFLQEGKFMAFTTTFEDLHGMAQLPGLAVQRLMAQGYGFGAEGDWKHAALVHAMKVMGTGLEGGTSFMEDYTYHLHPDGMKVLGAHMLEICPSVAESKPSLEVHPLGIGGKDDPARLVFNVPEGPAVNASIVDMGNRFRMIVNKVNVVKPDADFPKLPVARALWVPQPNLQTGAAAWILAGGAHHTSFSMSVNSEYLEDFAEMAGIEMILIDNNTVIPAFKKELRWNEMYYMLAGSLK
jgi:L-arabinose isomerase